MTFLGFETRSFPQGTHTVADAAAAVGVEPGQIVKSLVLRREGGDGLLTVIDRDLLAFGVLWAAAGSPYEVFPLARGTLVELTGGRVADVAESSS